MKLGRLFYLNIMDKLIKMFDLQYPRRKIILVAVLLIFLLIEELCQQVYSKDIILENEEDVVISALLGDSLNVKCGYSGALKIENVEWKKIKNNRWNAELSSIVLNRSQWLCLNKTNLFDEGKYSCSINGYNGNGTFSVKRGFALNLWKNRDYSSQFHWMRTGFIKNPMPKHVPLLANGTLRLNCPFKSIDQETIDYSWYKNDKLLMERKAIIYNFGYKNKLSSMIVDNEYSSKPVKMSDSGNYTCVVRKIMDSIIQHTFTVDVYENRNEMPISFEYPQDLSLKSGETAQFYCNAFYNCDKQQERCSKLNWYFSRCTNLRDIDINTVNLSQFKKLESNFNVTMVNNKLRLEFVTIHDAGLYICMVEGYQNNYMAAAKLEVDKHLINADFYDTTENCNAPKFTKLGNMPKKILLNTENILKLECEAKGIPSPIIKWYKDGVTPIKRELGSVEYMQWTIILNDLVTTDSGNYTCKVSNENGFIDFTYDVKIISK